jgi:hypothetical protein
MNVLATQRGSRHYPSMLEDIEAHRRTEIDHITGALVREAERVGVPAPLHAALYRLVKAREASWHPIDPPPPYVSNTRWRPWVQTGGGCSETSD